MNKQIIFKSLFLVLFFLLTSNDTFAQVVPTANLTVNNQKNIVVRSGDLVTYRWSSTGGNSFNSAYLGAPQTGYNKNCATGKSILNTASGSFSEKMTNNQVGCIYVFMYTAYNSVSGKNTSDFASIVILPAGATLPTTENTTDVVVPVPVPNTLNITLNNLKDLTVRVGDSVRIAWKSFVTGSSNLQLSYSGLPSRCTSGPFAYDSTDGIYDLYMFPGYAGCTFTFTYKALVGDTVITDTAILRVNN